MGLQYNIDMGFDVLCNYEDTPNHRICFSEAINSPNFRCGKYLINSACDNKHYDCLQDLIKKDPKFVFSNIDRVIKLEQHDILELYIQNGLDINDVHPETSLKPIQLAIASKSAKNVEFVILLGARLDGDFVFKSFNKDEFEKVSISRFAIESMAEISILELLIKYGDCITDEDIKEMKKRCKYDQYEIYALIQIRNKYHTDNKEQPSE